MSKNESVSSYADTLLAYCSAHGLELRQFHYMAIRDFGKPRQALASDKPPTFATLFEGTFSWDNWFPLLVTGASISLTVAIAVATVYYGQSPH